MGGGWQINVESEGLRHAKDETPAEVGRESRAASRAGQRGAASQAEGGGAAGSEATAYAGQPERSAPVRRQRDK